MRKNARPRLLASAVAAFAQCASRIAIHAMLTIEQLHMSSSRRQEGLSQPPSSQTGEASTAAASRSSPQPPRPPLRSQPPPPNELVRPAPHRADALAPTSPPALLPRATTALAIATTKLGTVVARHTPPSVLRAQVQVERYVSRKISACASVVVSELTSCSIAICFGAGLGGAIHLGESESEEEGAG